MFNGSPVRVFVAGVIIIGLATTAVLPKRQTPAVVGAFGTAGAKLLGTAMGTAQAAKV